MSLDRATHFLSDSRVSSIAEPVLGSVTQGIKFTRVKTYRRAWGPILIEKEFGTSTSQLKEDELLSGKDWGY